MRRLFLIAVLALTGCTSFDTAQNTIAERGAAISDEARETASWTLCKAISVGSWVRAYGDNPAKASAWRTLCATNIQEIPSKGVTP